MNNYVLPDLFDKFEFHNYGHALEILSEAFPDEWLDIQVCLAALHITKEDLLAPGGNETSIPKKFDDILYPRGWREIRITGDLSLKCIRVVNHVGVFPTLLLTKK